jgi:hypothetical protein
MGYHNSYSSSNVSKVIESRTMRLAGNVARIGEVHTKIWPEKLKGRGHLEDLGVDGKIILEWVWRK